MKNHVKEQSNGKPSTFLIDELKIMSKKMIKNRTKMDINMADTKKKWMRLTRNT